MMKRITVRAITGAKESKITREGDLFKIRVAAKPIEGEANKAIIAALADYLDLPKSSIRIVMGGKSRDKVVEIEE